MRSALTGFLNPFLYYLVLFKAYDLLPAQEAQPLNYTWPVVLSLLSVPLLRQPLGGRALADLLVSFAGVVVITTRGDWQHFRPTDPVGCGLALGSALIWAVFWIANVRDHRDPVLTLLMSFLTGTFYTSLLVVSTNAFAWTEPAGLAAVYVGLFEMGLTFIFWLRALSLARDTASVSNLIYLSPFLALVFIHFVVGETIRPSSIVGLAFIVAGIVIQAGVGKSGD